ncbi:PREDICTED: uncharacterized protein LOC109179701 [Ipomoea nil]|uniref:uncharacterized protein LOC109179701 n=1 Tax=Ipomoea nil TaxID=35883 RepID=UPI0009017B75|nr:PREDICTED: uncharacterized protein LOC109179701 [Ipomoea nil]
MCIDYTNLNKACPKDLFLLPRINQLVDDTTGCALLSFMDAFRGYHQIFMHESDEEKTAFITPDGVYCYRVMLFGLKNARATYTRMVARLFKGLMGGSMAVYVDEMLVKSKEETDHVKDLMECFEIMRKFSLKLNPKKCAFAVRGGKFLRYMVTQRGIEPNPEKTEECQAAFEDLKKYLLALPLLSKPKAGETLLLYLAVSHKAVGAVLVREDEKAQLSVYYVGRTLKEEEIYYSLLKKVAFALIMTVRKLVPYFQAHTVRVLIDLPLASMLHNPASSGRLLKWVIELTQYGIEYAPRPSIKAQALAEFIVECFAYPTEGSLVEGPEAAEWCKITLWRRGDDHHPRRISLVLRPKLKNECLTREERLILYKDVVEGLLDKLEAYEITHIPRVKNTEADILSKLAAGSVPPYLSMTCHTKIIERPSTDVLSKSELPDKKGDAGRIRRQASSYELVDGLLYKRSYGGPLLRCLSPKETKTVMAAAHRGIYAAHQGANTLAIKLIIQGYYWSTMAVKRYQDKRGKVRYLEIGDLVLRERTASRPTEGGKMAVKWDGSYWVVSKVYPGTYRLETTEGEPVERIWNAHHLKKFYK